MTDAAASPSSSLPVRRHDRLRPTWRAVAIFAAGIPVGFITVAWAPDAWLVPVVTSLAVFVLVAADALLIVPRHMVDVAVRAPARLGIGETAEVRVDLSILPRRRSTRFILLLEASGPVGRTDPFATVTNDGRLAIALPVEATRRGRILLDALWLRWSGPLGLVDRRWRLPLDRAIDVVPLIRGLRSTALHPTLDDARFGAKVERRQGEGSEFETLREHVAGLDNRHIDWKRSARHSKLLSKVFRSERNHHIVLAYDSGHLMLEPIDGKTRLDHAIEAGLLLAWISLKSGDLVGNYAFDAGVRQYLAPGAGLPYLARVQTGLARLAYTTEETNFTLGIAELDRRLRRRALLVLFTEFVDTVTAELLLESVQRALRRHVVILVTLQDPGMRRIVDARPDTYLDVARSVVAGDLMRERAVVLEKLTRMGVHVLDVPVGGLTGALLNRYIDLKQRNAL